MTIYLVVILALDMFHLGMLLVQLSSINININIPLFDILNYCVQSSLYNTTIIHASPLLARYSTKVEANPFSVDIPIYNNYTLYIHIKIHPPIHIHTGVIVKLM